MEKTKTSVAFEIGDMSKMKTIISPKFVSSGGYEWYAVVQNCSSGNKDYLYVALHLANPESLSPGWTRRVNYETIMLNQSGKEVKKTSQVCCQFSRMVLSSGFNVLVTKRGFLQKNQVTIKVNVKVLEEVVHEKKRFALWLKEKLGKKKAVAGGFSSFKSTSIDRSNLLDISLASSIRKNTELLLY